eukprot:scaffold127153_cov17-Tisochrysis_lutea.AAC.2
MHIHCEGLALKCIVKGSEPPVSRNLSSNQLQSSHHVSMRVPAVAMSIKAHAAAPCPLAKNRQYFIGDTKI